jgi:hypothetical protein
MMETAAKKGFTYREFPLTRGSSPKSDLDYVPFDSNTPPFSLYEENGKLALISGDETSTFFVRKKSSGISKNGKPWSRWSDLAMLVISVRPDRSGTRRLNIYVKYRKSAKYKVRFQNGTPSFHSVHSMFFNYGDMLSEIAKECVNLYEKHIGQAPDGIRDYPAKYTPLLLAYPMVWSRVVIEKSYGRTKMGLGHAERHLNLRTLTTSSVGALSIRSATSMEFTLKTFGKLNYRKDLVKATANGELGLIYYARHFRNLVPTDWIVNFLKQTTLARETTDPRDIQKHLVSLKSSDLRSFLLDVPQNILKRLLTVQTVAMAPQHWGMEIHDTIQSYRVIVENGNSVDFSAIKKVNTWKEIHNYFASEVKKLKTKNRLIPPTPLSKKIVELPEEENFSIILPKDTHTLLTWGSSMNHCIGSYASNAVSGSDVFIGIIKDEKMIGNAQIQAKTGNLIQIFGKHNQYIEPTVLQSVVGTLVKKKVIAKSSLKSAFGYSHLLVKQ